MTTKKRDTGKKVGDTRTQGKNPRAERPGDSRAAGLPLKIVLSATAGGQPPPVEGRVQVALRPEPGPPPDLPALLRESGPGTALIATRPGGPDGREALLLVRARAGAATEPVRPEQVELRAGLFTQPAAGVVLLPVLVRIGPEEPENLYEAWLNEHTAAPDAALEALAGQERVAVCLVGEGCRLLEIVAVPNTLRTFAQEALRLSGGTRLSTGDAFRQARHAVYREHPSTRSLWRALQK